MRTVSFCRYGTSSFLPQTLCGQFSLLNFFVVGRLIAPSPPFLHAALKVQESSPASKRPRSICRRPRLPIRMSRKPKENPWLITIAVCSSYMLLPSSSQPRLRITIPRFARLSHQPRLSLTARRPSCFSTPKIFFAPSKGYQHLHFVISNASTASNVADSTYLSRGCSLFFSILVVTCIFTIP